MIDFKSGSLIKLGKSQGITQGNVVAPLLVEGEALLCQYQAVRDFVLFTNKRIIAVNVQGLTGKKKDYTSLPYSKIQAFSIETAGMLDLDAELDLYFSGLGHVRFEVAGWNDVMEIGKLISENVL